MKSSPLIRNAIKNLDFQVSYYDRAGFGSKELYKTSPFIVSVNQNHGQPINTVFNVEIMNDKSFTIKAKAGKTSIYNFSGGNVMQVLNEFKIDGAGEFGADVVSDYYDFKIMLNENFNPNEHKSNKFSFVIHDISSMVKAYQEEITVAPVDLETSVARISIKSEVPAKAIDLITSITDEYLSKDVQEKIHAAVKTTEYIDNQLGAITDSLQNAEMNLQRFRTSNQVIDITMKSGRAYDQLRDLEKEKAGILIKYKYYQHINEYFEKNKEISDLIAPSSMGIEDPLLNNLIQELTRLNAEKVSLIENNQGKSPYIKQINIKIDNLKNTISENIKYIMSTTEISLQEIEGRLNQLNAEINKLPTTERQLLGYERKFNLNDAIYTFLLERRAEAQIAKASYLSGAEIIEPTDIIGSRPVSPKKNLNYILGLILGLFIPFTAIRLKDIMQNRITDATDLNKITDLPILGQVYTNNKKIELVVTNFPEISYC